MKFLISVIQNAIHFRERKGGRKYGKSKGGEEVKLEGGKRGREGGKKEGKEGEREKRQTLIAGRVTTAVDIP